MSRSEIRLQNLFLDLASCVLVGSSVERRRRNSDADDERKAGRFLGEYGGRRGREEADMFGCRDRDSLQFYRYYSNVMYISHLKNKYFIFMYNLRHGAVFFAAVTLLFVWGCDSGGESGGDSAVDTVAVTGTTVPPNFQTSGEFGVSATPLDKDRRGIISNNVQGEVKIEHNPSKSGKNHSTDIEATVTVDSIRQASSNPLAASIVLDGSGSMGDPGGSDPFPNPLRVQGAKEFVDELDSRGNFEAAVFEFPGSSTSPSFADTDFFAGFTNDTDSLDNAIDKVEATGGTPMYNSLAEVLEYSENERPQSNNQKSIVLLADGNPNGFRVTRDSVCRSARQKNSPIFGIGLGPASDLAPTNEQSNSAITEMRQISSCTGGAYTGLIPDSLEVVQQAFSAAATSSSQGSINYGIKITNGLSQLDTGDTIRGTLTVSSGGSSSSGTFTFTVPASSSSSKLYKYK